MAEKNNRHRRRGGLGCSVKWKRNGKKQKNVLLVIKRGTEREKTVKKGEKNVARLALLTDGT
ncbi:MAG: hypothetical protein ACLRR4_11165 [Blautia sp.]